MPAQRKGGRHVAPADSADADDAPTEALPTAEAAEPEKSGSKTD
nr:hypothetical protein GCM10020092_015160 [Actinoplanes digitatis]